MKAVYGRPRLWRVSEQMDEGVMEHSGFYKKELDAVGRLDHRWMLVHRYGLINPLQVDRADWQDLPVRPVAPRELHSQAHLLPQLVCFDEMAPEARIDLLHRVERCQRRGAAFFCALLESGPDATRVAGQLGRRLILRRPGNARSLFRYYDPHVFRHMEWLLDPAQRNALLGPVRVWSWPVGDGRWRRTFQDEAAGEPLTLTAPQWQSLERMALLNRCLEELAIREPEREQDAALAQWVDTLLDQAQRIHGLEDDADRLLYAGQAVRFHPHIHRHPMLDERLRRLRGEPELTYRTVCGDLDDNALQDMTRTLVQDRDRGMP